MLVERDIGRFAKRLRGQVIRPADAIYDEARAVWNGMIDRSPALIAVCEGPADVVECVRFAREQGLRAAVRGGGHGVAGNAVCDDGLVIDLSRMKAVRVDARARSARVQGGATVGDLDRETQTSGLATPGGIISTTGVAGLTLGGGFGWLSRLHGLAADNLLSVEAVTADGDILTADAGQQADLFWGVRGGGGNFAVVTSFEFQLHAVGPEVLFGPTVYRYEDAAAVLRHYRDFCCGAPRECSVYADLLTAPPLPFLPEQVHGTKILSLLQFYRGDLETGFEVLRPLREYGSPIADAVGPTRYAVLQSISDPLYEKGARNYWKSHNLTALSDEAIDVLVDCAGRLPTPQSDILIHQLGGAVSDVAPEATAYPHRDVQFVVTPGGRWREPARDSECIEWVRSCHRALGEHATGGTYVNFISEGAGVEREAYGSNYDRLVELKNKYDPTNFFRLNQNVRPSV